MAANSVENIPSIPLIPVEMWDQVPTVVTTPSKVESASEVNVRPDFCDSPCSHCAANKSHVQWKGLDAKQIPFEENDLRTEKSIPKGYLAVLNDPNAAKLTTINWHGGFAIHDYGNGREFHGFKKARLNHINPGFMLNHGVQDDKMRFINFDDLPRI